MLAHMRPCEVLPVCCLCTQPVYKADSVPTAGKPSPNASNECGYEWRPFCWLHAMERREVATNRLIEVVICETQGIARIDYDRAGGGAVCQDCGREYRRHPEDVDHPYLTVLCSGAVVKL